MNIVIVEDELPAVQLLKRLLADADASMHVAAVLDSVAAAVAWFERNDPPDLAFMDIRLSDGISFAIFERCTVGCPVIFTTAYDEYAVRAFKVNSIDYLLKPLDADALGAALRKHRTMREGAGAADNHVVLRDLVRRIADGRPAYRSRFLIPGVEQYVPVPVADVLYFTSSHKQTWLVTTANRMHPLAMSLDALEQELDPAEFFRANRGVILHHRAITAIKTWFGGKLKLAVRHAAEDVIVSRERAGAFKRWMDN